MRGKTPAEAGADGRPAEPAAAEGAFAPGRRRRPGARHRLPRPAAAGVMSVM
jgi:hypothetical protein